MGSLFSFISINPIIYHLHTNIMNKIIDISNVHIGSTEGTLEELFNDTNDKGQ